jgi:putative ABC transport system permease protein
MSRGLRGDDLLSLASESLRLHRMRTGLTLTGIVIGVTAVLLLTTLGEAAKAYVVGQFANIGTNLIMVQPGKTETSGMPQPLGGTVRPITIEDAVAIGHESPAVKYVAPVALGTARFEYSGRTRDIRVVGTTADYQKVRNMQLLAGSFLPPGDPRRGEPVAVIGRTVAVEVFGGESPLGKPVRIGLWRFRVVGELTSKGQAFGMNLDDAVLVPVATALRMFDQRGLFRAAVQARDASVIPQALEETRQVLLRRHEGEEDFTLITQDAMLATFKSVIGALTAALAGIAAISLAVAGIGIMNVMLVSVSERTAEVGLLKALGAGRGQILSLFLTEAVMLSGAGAILGIVLGVTIVWVAAALWPDMPLRPSLPWIAAVTMLALAAGLLFGLLPARRAAHLPAAEALRGRM